MYCRFEKEVNQWDDTSNDIIVLAKEMCWMVMDMSDFLRCVRGREREGGREKGREGREGEREGERGGREKGGGRYGERKSHKLCTKIKISFVHVQYIHTDTTTRYLILLYYTMYTVYTEHVALIT